MTEIIFADNTPQEMRDEVLRLAAEWRPRKRELIRGAGMNDADYITSARTIYGQWICPLYQKWSNMLARVYSPACHRNCPSYEVVEVHQYWLSFMSFRNWCLLNGWRSDYHLDKDFISDQQIYGPDTCAFIPAEVNTFIIAHGAARGDYPIGASRFRNKFQAQCGNPFTKKVEHLGLFDTPEEAHNCWKQKKHEHALALANMFPDLDPRVLHELRTRYKS